MIKMIAKKRLPGIAEKGEVYTVPTAREADKHERKGRGHRYESPPLASVPDDPPPETIYIGRRPQQTKPAGPSFATVSEGPSIVKAPALADSASAVFVPEPDLPPPIDGRKTKAKLREWLDEAGIDYNDDVPHAELKNLYDDAQSKGA